jgi:ribosomal protein L37E
MKGEPHYKWGQFTSADPQSGRYAAQRRFPLGMCERCNVKPARDRHHKDGNTFNNDPSNIERLCRSCHMLVDKRFQKAPRPCARCGKLAKRLRHDLCSTCYMGDYQRAHREHLNELNRQRWAADPEKHRLYHRLKKRKLRLQNNPT